jgi:hypothetical protein
MIEKSYLALFASLPPDTSDLLLHLLVSRYPATTTAMPAFAASTTAMISNFSKSYKDFFLRTLRRIGPGTPQEELESCAESSAVGLFAVVIIMLFSLFTEIWSAGMVPVVFATFALTVSEAFFSIFATFAVLYAPFTRGAFISYALLAANIALMHLIH